jgi:hypothetical protein
MAQPRIAIFDKAFWNPKVRRDLTREYEEDAAMAQSLARQADLAKEYGLREVEQTNQARRAEEAAENQRERDTQKAIETYKFQQDYGSYIGNEVAAKEHERALDRLRSQYGLIGERDTAQNAFTREMAEYGVETRPDEMNRKRRFEAIANDAVRAGFNADESQGLAQQIMGNELNTEIQAAMARNRLLAEKPLYGLPGGVDYEAEKLKGENLSILSGKGGGGGGARGGRPARIPAPGPVDPREKFLRSYNLR